MKNKVFLFCVINLIAAVEIIYAGGSDGNRRYYHHDRIDNNHTIAQRHYVGYLDSTNRHLPSSKKHLFSKLERENLSDFEDKTHIIDSILTGFHTTREILGFIQTALYEFQEKEHLSDEQLAKIKHSLFTAIFDPATLRYLHDDGYFI